jgi:CheY-like chemotaxis protein
MLGFLKSTKWPELSFEEIKKRSRLLVIDDNEFPYKELFERDGYTIDKWDDIENLSKLENGYYDIILLDIQGVGESHSEEQGFGILKHLRTTTPAQIVIAYSNTDWSLKYQDFFDLADSRLDKRADYVDFKRKVDGLLKERFSLGFFIGRIDKILSGSVLERDKIRRTLEKSIQTRNVDKLSKYLNAQVPDKDKVQIALSVAQVAIGIASL